MRHDDPSTGHRHERLQEVLFEELRALLRDDVEDPALEGVRFTALVLSVDYRHARVHFAVQSASDEARRRAEAALARATPFLRAQLAIAVDLKRVPELRFVYDGAALPEGA